MRRIRELMHFNNFVVVATAVFFVFMFFVFVAATSPAPAAVSAVVFKTSAALKHFYGSRVLVAHNVHASVWGVAHTHSQK